MSEIFSCLNPPTSLNPQHQIPCQFSVKTIHIVQNPERQKEKLIKKDLKYNREIYKWKEIHLNVMQWKRRLWEKLRLKCNYI